MQTSVLRKRSALRLVLFAMVLLALLVSLFLQKASARGTDQPLAQVATSTNGYWKFVNATPFDKFTSPGPGSTWAPTFGETSNGGTVVTVDGNISITTTTQCSWSIAGNSQALIPGQTVQVALTIESTTTTSGNTSVSNTDSMKFIDFVGNSSSAHATAGANANQTGSGKGTGSASFVVQPGWTGAAKPATRFMQFQCSVAAVGIVDTTWNYVWVEGPTSGATDTPVSPEQGTPSPTAPGESGETPSTGAGSGADMATILAAAGVAAGVIAVLLAALGLVALITDNRNKGGKPSPKKTGPKPNEPDAPQVHYMLKASPGSVDVYLNRPASVTFTAMRILPEGGSVLAEEAVIQVFVPESPAGLVGSPTSGSGSLTCSFSVPAPKVCASLEVAAIATVGGLAKARAVARVRILPLYELELKWDDPQQGPLQVDGKEALAWARVNSTPPDPDTPADVLAQQVNVSLQGPNADWIRQPLSPYIQYEKQWNAIAAVRPSADAQLQSGSPELLARFSAAGQQLVARLCVDLNTEVKLGAWVNGNKETNAVFQRNQEPQGWEFADILTYFHTPDEAGKPVHPSFNYHFDKPSIQADPDILEGSEPALTGDYPDQYVIKVTLKPGTDLDACFGNTPVDQRVVKVKVTARDESGKPYEDDVTYRVPMMVSFCVHAFLDNPAVPLKQHEYRSLQFDDPQTLVANADDTLNLAGYFMRTDLLARTGPDPAEHLDIGQVDGFSWRASQDETDLGTPQDDDTDSKDGFICFTLKSGQPLQAATNRQDAAHTLVVKPGLRADLPSGYTLESEELEVSIDVQYLRLRLWVMPGAYRHTSEALAYLDLLPSHKPLPGQDVYLGTVAPDGMALTIDDGDPCLSTIGVHTIDKCGTGAAHWRLRYGGITWDNMPNAKFEVHAGLEDPPDDAWGAGTNIDVYSNLLQLLDDLTDDKDLAKKINNPKRDELLSTENVHLPPTMDPTPGHIPTPEQISQDEKNLRSLLVGAAFPWAKFVALIPQEFRHQMYGPVYNLWSWLGYGQQYVCSKMRDNIIEWLEQRRFKKPRETAMDAVSHIESMNGLDFGHYALVPAHVWAGIFPAGADRFAEYRALDPWWGQFWPDVWREPEYLITQTGENMRGIIFKALNYLLKFVLIRGAPDLEIDRASQVIVAWLSGDPPERVDQILHNNGFSAWWQFLNLDSDNADPDGKYLMGVEPENWFQDLIKDLG